MPPHRAPIPTPIMTPRNRTEPGSSVVSVRTPARAENGATTKSTNPANDSPLLGIGRPERAAISSNDPRRSAGTDSAPQVPQRTATSAHLYSGSQNDEGRAPREEGPARVRRFSARTSRAAA